MSLSLEYIMTRCEEDCDCLVWKGNTKPSGSPVANERVDGKNYQVQIRRQMWTLTRGPIPEGRFVTNACTNPRCLAHLKLITPAERNRRLWKRPDIRSKIVASMTRNARQSAKIDMEKARYIRSSNATLKSLSIELGISHQLVSQIRRGTRWKDTFNPFAGLGS